MTIIYAVSEISLNYDFRSKIEVFKYFPPISIKYDRWERPRAQHSYSRDETDLIEQVRGSDFVAASTFLLISIEKWMQYLVKFQTLQGWVWVGGVGAGGAGTENFYERYVRERERGR